MKRKPRPAPLLPSHYRTTDPAFREALRNNDTLSWLQLWQPYGACTECLQQAGAPCLDLHPDAETVHLADPHTGRPNGTEPA